MDDELFGGKKSEFIGIRISPWMKELFSDEAKQQGLTLSAFCCELMGIGFNSILDDEER
jgi:hypothetical protein